MKKTISAVVALALGASLAVAAPHGDKGGRHGKGGYDFSEKLAQKLNLSEAQKQQIGDIEKSFREQNAAFFQTWSETKRQYRAAKEANDTAAINSLKPTLDAQKAQMKQLREAQHQRVLSILTPEQRTQLEALKAERESRHGKKKNW